MLVLYHGSERIIKKPIFGFENRYNDYGFGFYCTQTPDLAKELATRKGMDGYANKYILNDTGLSILNLFNKNYTILHWMALLL